MFALPEETSRLGSGRHREAAPNLRARAVFLASTQVTIGCAAGSSSCSMESLRPTGVRTSGNYRTHTDVNASSPAQSRKYMYRFSHQTKAAAGLNPGSGRWDSLGVPFQVCSPSCERVTMKTNSTYGWKIRRQMKFMFSEEPGTTLHILLNTVLDLQRQLHSPVSGVVVVLAKLWSVMLMRWPGCTVMTQGQRGDPRPRSVTSALARKPPDGGRRGLWLEQWRALPAWTVGWRKCVKSLNKDMEPWPMYQKHIWDGERGPQRPVASCVILCTDVRNWCTAHVLNWHGAGLH